HNPEFTMLEAYEAYSDYEDIMAMVEDLVRSIAEAVISTTTIERDGHSIDLAKPFRRVTMFEAIEEATGRDLRAIWDSGDHDELESAAQSLDVQTVPGWPAGKQLAAIFEAVAQKTFVQPTFVTGFPKDVSPLTKDHRSIRDFAEHADLIIAGVEMGPCYSELNDPEEQRHRFQRQAEARAQGDAEATLPDEDFLEALAYAMPPAGGFGLGLDRLLMLLLGASSIREVILFPTLRPR
nr:lysine--tRNA ligase [Actinomycetota bacterium]